MTKDEAITVIESQLSSQRRDLMHKCRMLSQMLNRIAARLGEDEPHDMMDLNSLGEVQATGPMIDAMCARFMATERALRTLKEVDCGV